MEVAMRGGIYDTKVEATDQGRAQAKREKTELVIHGRDGKIQDSDSSTTTRTRRRIRSTEQRAARRACQQCPRGS
jgi:hypothetical protein